MNKNDISAWKGKIKVAEYDSFILQLRELAEEKPYMWEPKSKLPIQVMKNDLLSRFYQQCQKACKPSSIQQRLWNLKKQAENDQMEFV